MPREVAGPRGVRSTHDHQWLDRFEEMYDPTKLDLPFFAVLGNHDGIPALSDIADYLRGVTFQVADGFDRLTQFHGLDFLYGLMVLNIVSI